MGMQLAFLMSRHKQLSAFAAARRRPIVADFTPAKDRMFARLLLRDRELNLYEAVSQTVNINLMQPDLTVYLDAKNSVLLKRIRARGRQNEDVIDAAYLDLLRQSYKQLLRRLPKKRHMTFDTSHLNLDSKADLHNLFSEIEISARLAE
jgi:deoxyadenosine/deoxycytidine kinase